MECDQGGGGFWDHASNSRQGLCVFIVLPCNGRRGHWHFAIPGGVPTIG